MLAVAGSYEEPLQYVESAMAAFDAVLVADPEGGADVRDRDRELMEQEVA